MTMPALQIKGLTVSRLAVGGNPISGFSHSGPARTAAMMDYFTTANVKRLLRRCEERGINAAFMRADNHIIRLLREYWNEGGRIQWIAQTVPGEDRTVNIRKAKEFGASAIYIHGGDADGLFERGALDEIRLGLECIRELGLPAGCASHVPGHLLEIERRGWPADFFMVCLHNIGGYRGALGGEQEEDFSDGDRAIALDAIASLPRPCFAYKILAAGRRDPRRAFQEVFSRLKPTDGVVVGMYPPDAGSGDIVAENAGYVNEFGQLSEE